MAEAAADDPDRRGCMMVNAAMECHNDESVSACVAMTFDDVCAALEQSIVDGRRRGTTRDAAAPSELAEFLFTVLQGMRVTGEAGTPSGLLHSVVDQALDVLAVVAARDRQRADAAVSGGREAQSSSPTPA